MSSKKQQEIRKEEKEWDRVDDVVFESGNFFFKHQKQILIAIGALVVIACAILAYRTFYLAPKTLEAQVAIFKGQQYFEEGRDSLALFGDGNGYVGFETIINDYSSTKTGELAKLYAGIVYSRLGQYEKATEYLKGYSANDLLTPYMAQGALGDCYVNTGKLEDGAKKFLEASKGANDKLLTPFYAKKAALVYLDLKNYDKVIELFTQIKNEYMNSVEAVNADKYIEEAKLLKAQ